MRKCTKCMILKKKEEFDVHKGMKDGLQPSCRICKREANRLSYYRHKEAAQKRAKKIYDKNREVILSQKKQYFLLKKNEIGQKKKKYYEQNKEKILSQRHEYYEQNKESLKEYKKEYRKNNVGKCNALSAKKYARKTQSTPKWLTKEQLDQINEFYIKAKILELETGIKYQVDHIIPIRGKTVCGLHVPWNLQILTAEENNRKRNKLIYE